MYCRYCGKEIAEDAKFCPFCGNRRFKKVPPKRSKKAEKNIWEIANIFFLLCIIIVAIGILLGLSDRYKEINNLRIEDIGGNILITAADIEAAELSKMENSFGEKYYAILLHFTEKGTEKFSKITRELMGESIYVYVGDNLIDCPLVNVEITDGKAYVAHCETRQEASALLDEICGKSEDVTKGTFFGDKIPKYWLDDSVKVNRIEVDDTEIR